MKICVITSPFGAIPPIGRGAVETRWFHVCHELAFMGHEISFISKRSDFNNYEIIDNIGVKGFNRTGVIYLDICLDLVYSFKALRKLKSTDILVLNTFWTPLISFLYRKKFKASIYNVARMPKGQLRLYFDVDRFACVSNAVYKRVIQSSNSFKKKAIVINNPIDSSVFSYQEPRVEDGTFRILYFGRIHPEKGLEILVKSVNELIKHRYKVKLCLMGPSKIEVGGGGKRYIAKLNRLCIGHFIEWKEAVTESKDLLENLKNCDVFCYPSIAENGETFGIAPLEAMGAGRPTIVSSLECFRDFISENENALVFDHRSESPELHLSEKIKCLINNSNLRLSIAKNGAATAREFSFRAISLEYIEDFKRLLMEN